MLLLLVGCVAILPLLTGAAAASDCQALLDAFPEANLVLSNSSNDGCCGDVFPNQNQVETPGPGKVQTNCVDDGSGAPRIKYVSLWSTPVPSSIQGTVLN
jgi:hypothetical protein